MQAPSAHESEVRESEVASAGAPPPELKAVPPEAPAGGERRKARVRGPGLQAKIILLMVVSFALLALISSFATLAVLTARMQGEARSKGEAVARGLAAAAEPLLAGNSFGEMRALLPTFEEIEGVAYLVVYDGRGQVLASSYPGSLPGVLARPPAAEASGGQLAVPDPSGTGQVTALDLVSTAGAVTARVGMDLGQVFGGVQRVNLDLMVIQGVVALVAVLFAILFSARLVRPIRALVKAARRLGEGDLSQTVRPTSTDEVGLLTRTFNDTIRRLRGLVITEAERDEERRRREALQENIRSFLQVTLDIARGDLRRRGKVTEDVLGSVVDSINLMVEEIGQTLMGVREAAITVHGSADEVIRTTEQVASAVAAQREAARQVSESVAGVSASVRGVSETAEASSETARQTQDAARTGQTAVRETLDSMERIRKEVKEISRRIKSLGDRSLEISEIVDTISRISSQTNLLALNAAIEASGAGEHGARFAVVADEVRKLAEEAAASSRGISRLIKTVQSEINDAVGAMEEGTEEVETGFLLARQAGERLEQIARISEASAELAQRISAQTGAQVEGMERVSGSVSSIAELAQQTDATVAGGRRTVEKVRELAEQLNRRLAGFQLPEAS